MEFPVKRYMSPVRTDFRPGLKMCFPRRNICGILTRHETVDPPILSLFLGMSGPGFRDSEPWSALLLHNMLGLNGHNAVFLQSSDREQMFSAASSYF